MAKKVSVLAAIVLLIFIAVKTGLYRQIADYLGIERLYVKKKAPIPAPRLPGAKIAIVIDDMGRDIKTMRRILKIDIPIAIAVLPHLPHSREIAREAMTMGRDVLLHLPMEPIDVADNNPGKGALYIDMTENEIRAQVEDDLNAVPYVDGVNNHMGSRFTEDERLMNIVLDVIKKRGDLFFLDSKTSGNSKAYKLAREMHIRTAERKVFLDNSLDRDYIKNKVMELIRIAKRDGKAIAIGHPHKNTIQAIKEMLPHFRQEGIEVVNLSELVE